MIRDYSTTSSTKSFKTLQTATSAAKLPRKPNNQNMEYITLRMEEIRKKYAMGQQQRTASNSKNIVLNHTLDSPYKMMNSNATCEESSKAKIEMLGDPRIDTIDKITQKIRNILGNNIASENSGALYRTNSKEKLTLNYNQSKVTLLKEPRQDYYPQRIQSKWCKNIPTNTTADSYKDLFPIKPKEENKKQTKICKQFQTKSTISSIPKTKDQTKRLINQLKKQVEFDQTLRNKKYAFRTIKEPNKNEQMLKALKKVGIILSQSTLDKQLEISQSQYDPFYTYRGDPEYDSIAIAYKQASLNWSYNLEGKFDEAMLNKESFEEEFLGIQKKGYLSIQDLVRMLNNSSDTFYRNRDVYLIYQRVCKHLKAEQKLQLSKFIKVIAS